MSDVVSLTNCPLEVSYPKLYHHLNSWLKGILSLMSSMKTIETKYQESACLIHKHSLNRRLVLGSHASYEASMMHLTAGGLPIRRTHRKHEKRLRTTRSPRLVCIASIPCSVVSQNSFCSYECCSSNFYHKMGNTVLEHVRSVRCTDTENAVR